MNKNIIAIDGPAGSGKSTVAKQLAVRVGFKYFDSGAYYRAVTLLLMRKFEETEYSGNFEDWLINVDADNLLAGVVLECDYSGEKENHILMNDEDVSESIRTPEVTSQIRYIANKRKYRDFVNRFIRKLAKENRLVMDGRDIGTEVFPDAVYKIYLTASSEVRAKRRHKDLMERNIHTDLEKLQNEIEIRDKTDMEREIAPLRKAKDAIFIDTSSMDKKIVIDKLLSEIELKKL